MKNGAHYFCTLDMARAATAPNIPWAHEEGAGFIGAIRDPARHHTHIENEQRLKVFALNDVPDANGS